MSDIESDVDDIDKLVMMIISDVNSKSLNFSVFGSFDASFSSFSLKKRIFDNSIIKKMWLNFKNG